MNIKELLLLRLQNQQLLRPSFEDPEQLLSWMGAVQAQDYAMAKWALGLRLTGATDALMEKAVAEGKIIRTHVLRPTWHLVAPADIRWMLKLTASRIHAFAAPYYRSLELDKKIFQRSHRLLEKILSGGKQLSRPDIAVAFEKAKISEGGQRLNQILMHAELEGLICSGGHIAKHNSYRLLEEWIPPAAVLNREESLMELARRYFQSHGPATVKDFSWWSGLTLTDARQGVQLIADQLLQEKLQGESYLYFKHTPEKGKEAVYLLPNYDEYVVAYAGRALLVSEEGKGFLTREGNPLFSNVVIRKGRVAGTWKRKSTAKATEVALTVQAPESQALQKQQDLAVKRYKQFIEG